MIPLIWRIERRVSKRRSKLPRIILSQIKPSNRRKLVLRISPILFSFREVFKMEEKKVRLLRRLRSSFLRETTKMDKNKGLECF
jgi:hypothetical protein